jgi:hypothetical protein
MGCSNGSSWDENLQSCVKDPHRCISTATACEPGYVWSQGQGACMGCSSGWSWDEASQKCVGAAKPPAAPTCPWGSQWDGKQCVKTGAIPDGGSAGITSY